MHVQKRMFRTHLVSKVQRYYYYSYNKLYLCTLDDPLWTSIQLGHNPASSSSMHTGTRTASAALDDECDIVECSVDLGGLTREHKHRILTTEINPNPTSYPRTRQCASGSYRQFQPAWKQQHPWLHYSCHLDGVFCHACALFAPEKAGGQALGQFVTTL